MDPTTVSSISFGEESSLATNHNTKVLGPSAAPVRALERYSGYGFIAVLGLAQRLNIDFLPITWQAPLGQIGRGGQAGINQALINIQISFAFKHFDYKWQDPFREIVQEMVVLSHQVIRDHKHIVRLEGICWDIRSSTQVRPVLVFQKTDLGDFHKFSKLEKFKSLSIEDKLNLCADVGIAIRDMHRNGIIHGDIKPGNVLIFEDDSRVTAKLADFGFATCLQSGEELLLIPVSEPWNAPEYSDHLFRPESAKKMDIYSFALLCAWLLFEAGSSGGFLLPPDINLETDQYFSFEPRQSGKNLLELWKRDSSNKLVKCLSGLVREDQRLNSTVKDNLIPFFCSTLTFDPKSRCTELEHLVSLLVPSRVLPKPESIQIGQAPDQEEFELSHSVSVLYISDFRLRDYIHKSLSLVATGTEMIMQHISPAKAALQLALCYTIGFGTIKDDDNAAFFLEKHSLQRTDLLNQVQLISNVSAQFSAQDNLYYRLTRRGYISTIDHVQYYRERQLLEQAETNCRREIQDLSLIFGGSHWLTWALRYILTLVIRSQGRWKETEERQLQLIEIGAETMGPEHPSTLSVMRDLIGTYVEQGQWDRAKELGIRMCHTYDRIWGAEHPFTVTCAADLAHVFRHEGEWENAVRFEKQVMAIREKMLSIRHPETLISMNNLALTYKKQGRWKESEELTMRVISACQNALEAEHPFVFDAMDNLASIYMEQGLWNKAQEGFENVMRAKEKVLGPEHPHTLISTGNLVSAYLSQGLWRNAEHLGLQIMKKNKEVLGATHPQTLISMSNLAFAYSSRGLWQEAERLESQVVEESLTKLGVDHMAIISNQVVSYRRQGRWQGAERLGKQVVEARERTLGIKHPDTLKSINNLASVLQCQAKFTEAETMLLGILEKVEGLSLDHPDTLIFMNNLGEVLSHQGRYMEAESIHRQMMKTRRDLLGSQHPNTLTSMSNLGSVLRQQGKYAEAEAMHRQALEFRKITLATKHPDIITSLSSLGAVLQDQRKLEEAESLHREAVKESIEVLGLEHPETLTSINNLGVTLDYRGKLEDAVSLHDQALQARKRTLGLKHPDTLTSHNNLASVLLDQGKNEAAETAYREVLSIRQEILGPEHPATLNSMNNLGLTLTYQKKFEEAETLHRDSLQMRERISGPKHPSTLASASNLALVLQSRGRYGEAEAMHSETLEIKKEVLGPEHPDTLSTMNNLAYTYWGQGQRGQALSLMRMVNDLRVKVIGKDHPDTVLARRTIQTWEKSAG